MKIYTLMRVEELNERGKSNHEDSHGHGHCHDHDHYNGSTIITASPSTLHTTARIVAGNIQKCLLICLSVLNWFALR